MVSVPALDLLFKEAAREATAIPSILELEARVAAARAAQPDIDVPVVAFIRRLAALSDPELPPVEHAGDIYLALACATGDAGALAAFARDFTVHLAHVIAQVDSSLSFRDEVMQVIREKLFVAHDDEPPKIAEYGGRASLKSWLRVVAKRTALNLVRDAGRHAPPQRGLGDDLDLLAASGASPELGYMKELYREQFAEATSEAFGELTSRERTVLRLHLVERMTLAQLGSVYDVSHATAARWLAATREKLVTCVRGRLTERLRLSPSEYDSVVLLVRSQLDVRVLDLLRSTSTIAPK